MKKSIALRTTFFLAVEGDSEQSFIAWLQQLCDNTNVSPLAHLDCVPLNGGGYKTMFRDTLDLRARKNRNRAKATVLLVDADRAERRDDGWSLEQLGRETEKKNIMLCLQRPNHEGLLYRMFPGKQSLQPDSSNAKASLKKIWPEYEKKKVNASTLGKKFSLEDLQRTAKADAELKKLLSLIGLHNE